MAEPRIVIDRTGDLPRINGMWATDAAIRAVLDTATAEREVQARDAARRALRPRLRWLVDRPRLLKWMYRLRLARRPVMYVTLPPSTDFEAFLSRYSDGHHG